MIQIQGLTKRYGDMVAVDGLNFSVRKGEVVGFLGPNGAGKSTTMKIITGYMAPTSGMVKVADHDVFENPIEVKRRIGFLPETPPLYTDMYVKDYLEFVARLKGVEKSRVNSQVSDALGKANIGDVQKRIIGNLSKGYKQRVGLAQALVSDPEILILDEPTVGLDPKQVAEIRTLIKQLSGHHTIILSTHILPEVQASCERIIIIHRGRIVAEDTLAGLNRKMTGARRFHLKVRKSDDAFLAMLRGVAGVIKVFQQSGRSEFEIDTEDVPSMEEKIAEVVFKSGVGLVELKGVEMNLEDIFLKVTSTAADSSGGQS